MNYLVVKMEGYSGQDQLFWKCGRRKCLTARSGHFEAKVTSVDRFLIFSHEAFKPSTDEMLYGDLIITAIIETRILTCLGGDFGIYTFSKIRSQTSLCLYDLTTFRFMQNLAGIVF
ncbi:predicted protein [Sclerotinia sclerotiorum 1980 UF-70]|uniref:Uncharacterized protein n=1 Tax=Sclerotinia sclerotiorum (strain ATCC 18683 / 1980 / Ss-1) TaxID=665079 RepID=A7EDR8_SCLS1|nr:predicted protein [Sclerotinia sclerotiorum 1980 UF-70]EDO00984.1 predicted protein [Sclerotinia sclerotiorum 1980 UF-70]